MIIYLYSPCISFFITLVGIGAPLKTKPLYIGCKVCKLKLSVIYSKSEELDHKKKFK